MKKLFLAFFILLVSCNTYAYNYYGYIKPYRVALTLSNPLSGSFKYGGGWEHRYKNFSYFPSYYLYSGAYPGAQMDLDLRLYFRKFWRMSTGWTYQHFMYVRGVYGACSFDGTKLSMLGFDPKVETDAYGYAGGAAGIGRRYVKGSFFITMKGGLKYVALQDMKKEDKNMFRLFYATGPGSILEFNIQLGIQF